MQMPDVVLELVTVVVAELATVGGGWGKRRRKRIKKTIVTVTMTHTT